MKSFSKGLETHHQNMCKSECVVIAILAVFGLVIALDDPIVQLPPGKIRGHILKSEKGNPYYAFQEIPYAAPPIGENRFQLPKHPKPWSGILNTTKNYNICPQVQPLEYPNLKKSEDCLYINVYTPLTPGTSKRLPVLVWIHGGEYKRHAGTYDYVGPKYVMDHEVVVVSFNFRLGPLGFISTFDDVIPPNLQLKDQHFALEWVQENIGLFGGNKSHVTIAGESAGAMSISLHVQGPWENDKVLYHAAILQSGNSLFYEKSNNAREEAFKLGRVLDKSFSSNDPKELLKVLQKASTDDILSNAGRPFPVVEKEGLFSYQTWDSVEKGNFKKIPLIMGFNSEESIYTYTPELKNTAAIYDKDPSKLFPRSFKMSEVNGTIAGNLLKKIYTNTSFEENIGAFIRWESDNFMSTGITKEAILLSELTDVYLYQFSYVGKVGGSTSMPYVPGAERVSHAQDLTYLWDMGSNDDLSKFPEEDKLMVHRYIKLWTNFVKYHNPTPQEDSFLQNKIWPKVNPKQLDNIQYLDMNATLEVRSNPRYFQKVNKVLDRFFTSKDIL